MSEHGLAKGVNLIGHSMQVSLHSVATTFAQTLIDPLAVYRGGKAVMAFALNDAFNGCLNTLISADMAPSIGKISPEYASLDLRHTQSRLNVVPSIRFAAYAKGMQEIEEANVRTKSEGDKLLQTYEKASLQCSLQESRSID